MKKGTTYYLFIALVSLLGFSCANEIKNVNEEEFTYSLFPIENNQYLSYLPLKVSSTGRYGVNLLDSNYNRVETLLEYSTEYPLAGQYFGFISQIGANKYGIFSQVENMVYHLESGHLQSAYKVDVKGKKDMSELEGKASLGLTDYEMEMIPYVFHYKENSRFMYDFKLMFTISA